MKKEIKILSWFYSFFITSNKLDFSLFIFTALIVSIIEVMSIASIIPFLEVVLSENMANDNKFVYLITEYFKFQTCDNSGVILSHASLTGGNYEKYFYQGSFRCRNPFWS